MTQTALQTRMVGYATDRTGHVMAPMEVVYDVEAPERVLFLDRLRAAWSFSLGVLTVVLALFGLVAGPLELFGVDVPSIFDLFGAQ